MKTTVKIAAATSILFILMVADIAFLLEQGPPNSFKQEVKILFDQLVPEAHAILGVRRRMIRRTAVVVGSAAAAEAVASEQQAAAAQQQAAASSAPIVPIGTVVHTLPGGCTAVTVGGKKYSDCGGVFYEAAFQGNKLVYVVSENPLK